MIDGRLVGEVRTFPRAASWTSVSISFENFVKRYAYQPAPFHAEVKLTARMPPKWTVGVPWTCARADDPLWPGSTHVSACRPGAREEQIRRGEHQRVRQDGEALVLREHAAVVPVADAAQQLRKHVIAAARCQVIVERRFVAFLRQAQADDDEKRRVERRPGRQEG